MNLTFCTSHFNIHVKLNVLGNITGYGGQAERHGLAILTEQCTVKE